MEDFEKIKKDIGEVESIIKKRLDEPEESKDALENFDIRKYLLEIIRKDLKRDLDRFDKANIVVQTCIVKKWANFFDYDVSLFVTYIFRKVWTSTLFPEDSKIELLLKSKSDYEYGIKVSEDKGIVVYRGDTMNSWHTMLDEFMRRCRFRGENIPANYASWESYLSISENYTEIEGLRPFMEVVYTIGNFIPVPSNFNGSRWCHTKDCWDSTLLIIYYYYFDPKELRENTKNWISKYTGWLGRFGTGQGQDGWDKFVLCNFMQPFVIKDYDYENEEHRNKEKDFGKPVALWQGHLDRAPVTFAILPKDEKEFQDFFENATKRIRARGKLIAEALKKNLTEEEPKNEEAHQTPNP